VTPTSPDRGDWVPPTQRCRPQVKSTTKLCMLRLEGVEDAYEPGTVPDRAYRRNPLLWGDEDGNVDCVFELVPDDAPASTKELENIQSFLVEETELAGERRAVRCSTGDFSRTTSSWRVTDAGSITQGTQNLLSFWVCW